ncbi:MAG: translation initiation factor IF-3 [Patescibacteria group bacterium]
MRKNYRKAKPEPKRKYRLNEAITAPQVRLIGDEGTYVGILSLEEALKKAKDAELDLVEINPGAEPPVCKIDDFGRLRYNEEKELRKQKANQKKVEIKGIRMSVRIAKHDLDTRVKQARKFLEQDDKVKLEIVLRGRERQHADLAREALAQFIASLEEAGVAVTTESAPALQGGRLTTVIGPKSK